MNCEYAAAKVADIEALTAEQLAGFFGVVRGTVNMDGHAVSSDGVWVMLSWCTELGDPPHINLIEHTRHTATTARAAMAAAPWVFSD